MYACCLCVCIWSDPFLATDINFAFTSAFVIGDSNNMSETCLKPKCTDVYEAFIEVKMEDTLRG